MPFFFCLSAKSKIFSLKKLSFIFTLGNDFTLHVNNREKRQKKINNIIFDFAKKKSLFISLRFFKVLRNNFPREWKFIGIIEINLIESKWIRKYYKAERTTKKTAAIIALKCLK